MVMYQDIYNTVIYSMIKYVDIFVNAHTQKGELFKKAYVKRY